MAHFPLIPGFLKGVCFATQLVGSAGRYHSSQDTCSHRASALWDQPAWFMSQQGCWQLTAVQSSALFLSRSLTSSLGNQVFWLGAAYSSLSLGGESLLVLRLIQLPPAAAATCSLVIDGALIYFIILSTGEFCLPFFFVLYFGFVFWVFFFRI